MKTENNSSINQYLKNEFIYEMAIINPITEIILKLERGEFRDCDMKWLNDNLDKYANIAICSIKSMGKSKVRIGDIKHNGGLVREGVLNDHNKERYLKAFKILLEYFKSVKD